MHLSFHRAFISIEILFALVIMGIGFKIFWEIYQENSHLAGLSQKDQKMFLAQKHMYQKIYSEDAQKTLKPFSIVSQKGFFYNGGLIDHFEEGFYYRYFYPQSISKNAH